MFEKIILQNIINNKNYGTAFLPFLKNEYLSMFESKAVFKQINKYFIEYKTLPHWNEIIISLSNTNDLSDDLYQKTLAFIEEIKSEDNYNIDWLSNETKKWIRNKAFEIVIVESAEKLQSNKPVEDMVEKVKDVFSINFNESIGNNFYKDYEKQYEFYTQTKEKFESNLTILNTVCDGGVERKTLNLLMAPTNTGKTSAMISLAAGYLRRGYNVLYITCEMSEENIRQRIDANFLDIPINDIPRLPKELYIKRMQQFASIAKSNLYVKEYPTASANVNHIRALLDALATKEKFVPDIVFIDYLNIMTSVRIKSGQSYEISKAIAEELRGLMVHYNLAGWSATQTNRGGDGASDLDLTDTSESYGVPMTVDMQIAVIQTPALLEQKRQLWKVLKTRYSEMKGYKFAVEHDFKTCSVKDTAAQSTNNIQQDNDEIKNTMNIVNNKERMRALDIDFD